MTNSRRVVMLETDERAGLVAALAAVCSAQDISLDIATGPGHVLITFEASDDGVPRLTEALKHIPGVIAIYPYRVAVAL